LWPHVAGMASHTNVVLNKSHKDHLK